MRFLSVGLSNYRNIELARLTLDSQRVFIVGENGQGKTNLLESLGLVTALRAFRTRENSKVIGPASDKAEAVFKMELEDFGEIGARVVLKRRGKEAAIDDEPIKRASDFVGRFPTVVLCSNDMQLLRGSPGLRRRYFDSFLCGVDREYFIALRDYTHAVAERNALLKQRTANAVTLDAFEKEIARRGYAIAVTREKGLSDLMEIARRYFQELSTKGEQLACSYQASIEAGGIDAYREVLKRNREVDTLLKSTTKGPHRDDYRFELNGQSAADYASEGQQRTCLISLALAIAEYWRSKYDISPVALADDALGELDPRRRERFWATLGEGMQVISTGTSLPETAQAENWLCYEAKEGGFQRR